MSCEAIALLLAATEEEKRKSSDCLQWAVRMAEDEARDSAEPRIVGV
jgi:hypothetical protein